MKLHNLSEKKMKSKKGHKFSINVGSALKAKQVKHEMKESPAYEKMEKKLMKKHAPKMAKHMKKGKK